MVALPFYKSRLEAVRAGFAMARANADRLAVASVHVPIKLLTDKERSRHVKVEALIAKGENPYTPDLLKETGKNLGGSNATERVIDYASLQAESEAHFQARLDKWSERPETPKGDNVIEGLDLRSEAEIKRDPLKLYCSFCSQELMSTYNVTLGTGEVRTMLKREIILLPNGLSTIEDKFIPIASKVMACPDCSLKVTKVKFPEFD